MAVQVHRLTGEEAEPTTTDITDSNTRLNAEDAHSESGTNNPILIPDDGTNYSYKASTQLYFDGSGTGTIDNIKWYTDGDNELGTGVGLQVATAGEYSQATGTEGETGDDITGDDAFNYTSGSPLDVDGSVTDPADELFGDIVELQTTVGDNASAGATTSETMTFRYDSTVA